MIENFRPKAILTLVLLLGAITAMLVPLAFDQKPFRLGLDLQGGTRLVYRFDFEQAAADGKISPADLANKPALLEQFIEIIYKRVDSMGVRELVIRPEGTDRISVELPSAVDSATTRVAIPLAGPINASDKALDLVDTKPDLLKAFPASGGTIKIGDERIFFSGRSGTRLTLQQRGAERTTAAAHDANTDVELLSNDDLQRLIENVGDMQFLIAAQAGDPQLAGTDLQKEQVKVDAWRAANPNEAIEAFNRLAPEAGGPVKGLKYFPHMDSSAQANSQRPLVPLIVPRPVDTSLPESEWNFTGGDAERFVSDADELGLPAVRFEMAPERKTAFGDFTQHYLRRGMAIVLNGEIVTLATINSKLPGGGIITGGPGGFKAEEVRQMVTVLQSGSLKIKPILLDKSRVGANLGEDYIRAGLWSVVVGMGVVVLFMVFTYRRLGLFSVVGLLVNMILILGVLALLRATLSLPGIAGMVLTIGMAVDGNILIFERLREERARGLKLAQAVQSAFDRAAVTIIDSNLTTLLAGVILLTLGTGPIKGFATTLCIGILTTLFTVIVITQVMLAWDLKQGRQSYEMRELIKGGGIDFLKPARLAITVSTVFIVGAIAFFAMQPNSKKLGIDFTGGFTATVRTQEAQPESKIEELVGAIPGLGESANIVPMIDSGSSATGYREFRITAKLSDEGKGGAAAVTDDAARTAENEIARALAPVLQRGPIEVSASADATAPVTGEIYFEDAHPAADVAERLKSAGVVDATVTAAASGPEDVTFSGKLERAASADEVEARIRDSFLGKADSATLPYKLRSPIPESSMVGSQVGGEMRDKAVRALILGLFATMLYLRVRFSEWSYGIAVVVSLAHDVLVTLGALALANATGLVQAEIDLTMIAAFLTIIGYSQNDTIVIFDRVRENRPRSKLSLKEIVNESVNQCLGRTILTSLTVFLTVVVLFAFSYGSRNAVEAFSFAMIIGVITGTYSTVYIASPVFLWCEAYAEKRAAREGGGSAGA